MLLMESSVEYGIGKPHDRLFKDILSNKKEFCEFINKFIKDKKEKDLLPENVEKMSTSYIIAKYISTESDILYKIKNENKYYLIEHQSTIDHAMAFRMLNYCIGILNDVTEKRKLRNKDYKIPKIIPIVLYTGDKTWNAKTRLTEKQEDTNNNGTLLEIKYRVIDINNIEEKELIKINTALAYGMLIEKNKGKEKLIKILNKIAKKCDTKDKEINMQKIIKYILEPVLGEKETEKMLKTFNKLGGEEIMTAIDCLIRDIELEKKEAREIGLQEGIEQSRKEIEQSKKEIAKKMREKGITIEIIKEVTGLTKEEIEKL